MSKDHLSRLSAMPCALCGTAGQTEVHHILEGRVKGRKSGHYTAIPLCVSCHRGSMGIHGNQAMLKIHKTTELELLGETIEKLMERL
jgi:hypothetical protein